MEVVNVLGKLRPDSVRASARKAIALFERKSGLARWRFRNAPQYESPTPDELVTIERALDELGVPVHDYAPAASGFRAFQAAEWFPANYHGGVHSGVWDEKLAEHWIASELLGLMDFAAGDVFVDVAAASSPWARALRERKGIDAHAIDVGAVPKTYRQLPYYRTEDATRTSFADASVAGASLHCAYEMFTGDDDIALLDEAARILRPGGKLVIVPLYTHTHYCTYSSPEHFGKGHGPATAKEYVRLDSAGVPSSRKYDAATLKSRVLDRIESLGMSFRVLALRNQAELGEGIYCHFILEITR